MQCKLSFVDSILMLFLCDCLSAILWYHWNTPKGYDVNAETAEITSRRPSSFWYRYAVQYSCILSTCILIIMLHMYTAAVTEWSLTPDRPAFDSWYCLLVDGDVAYWLVDGGQCVAYLTVLNGNSRPTCSDLHINMYCRPSYNVLFYFFLIVRRPWPNFVCKGRHTSSVVLVFVLVLLVDGGIGASSNNCSLPLVKACQHP